MFRFYLNKAVFLSLGIFLSNLCYSGFDENKQLFIEGIVYKDIAVNFDFIKNLSMSEEQSENEKDGVQSVKLGMQEISPFQTALLKYTTDWINGEYFM